MPCSVCRGLFIIKDVHNVVIRFEIINRNTLQMAFIYSLIPSFSRLREKEFLNVIKRNNDDILLP
jgi:hypothetical protein